MQSFNSSFTRFRFARLARAVVLVAMLAGSLVARAATPPQVGDDAPAFALKTLDGQLVDFPQMTCGRAAVLVVLRGWPGYQCPFCSTQVYEYVGHAADFAARDMPVVMVYPGPADELQAHAQEFLEDKRWPEGFYFVLDPDFEFSTRYGLRWSEKGETVYPSTFVIDAKGKIQFAQVSHEHGDRVGAASLLRTLSGEK